MPGTSAAIGGPRIERAVATTDGAGNAVVTWPHPFPSPPILSVAVEAGDGFRSTRVVSNTATGAVVHVTGAIAVVVLGISVLGAGVPAAGVQVHITAVGS